MKSGKPQLVASLLLLLAAIAYNVWSFRPAAPKTAGLRAPAPVDAVPAVAPPPSATDPLKLAAPPDVAIDSVPNWAHDPFADTHDVAPAPVEAEAPAAAPPAPEPEVTVASILYGDERQLAIVNGRIVRVGDRIAGSTVIEIQPRAVVFDGSERGRRTVALRAPGSAMRKAAK